MICHCKHAGSVMGAAEVVMTKLVPAVMVVTLYVRATVVLQVTLNGVDRELLGVGDGNA